MEQTRKKAILLTCFAEMFKSMEKMLRAMNNAMEKTKRNDLKNKMAIEILVTYFFLQKNIFSPRNTEIDNLIDT